MTNERSHLFIYDKIKLQSGCDWVIGVDEVGRGPLAGPVTAAGVAIHRSWFEGDGDYSLLESVNDSKKLSAAKRVKIANALKEGIVPGGPIQCSVCQASVEEIDRFNILEATKLAMNRVLVALESRLGSKCVGLQRIEDSMFELAETLGSRFPKVLVDGLPLKHFPFVHEAIVKGDGTSFTIALASVAAKVDRDDRMLRYHEEYPQYGWINNKGYGTAVHRSALLEFGASPHHRKTFIQKIMKSKCD